MSQQSRPTISMHVGDVCASFGLGWIFSLANLKDVFVHFEDLKYHGLTDVL